MAFKHSYLFPIAFCLLMPLTFVITYTTAVLNENVKPVFPYISDTGSWSPESCIFSFLLMIGAILLSFTSYVRYRQVRDVCEKNEIRPYVKKFNKYGLLLGQVAALGVIVVACFQETNVFVVHILGAIMTFGSGSVYHTIQVVMSFSMYPIFGKKSVNIIRAVCTILYFGALALVGIFLVLSFMEFEGKDITKWVKEDGGYDQHLVSTSAEWIMVLLNQLLILSFASEFRLIHFSEPQINIVLSEKEP